MTQWFFHTPADNQRHGPLDEAAAQDFARRTPGALAWREGMREWKPARELPELALDARCVPHVTLGYGDAMWPEAAVAPLRWTASELALLESRAGERDYRRLAGWSLSPD